MNYDILVTCPYDDSHRILQSKLAYHLTRCKKNHKDAKKKVCPFDSRHVIDLSIYQHHVESCPSKESILHYSLHDENELANSKILPVLSPAQIAVKDPDEDWDEDPPVKSYDPIASIQNRPVVRVLVGACKSEKKKFKEEERKRFQLFENENEKREKEKKRENMERAADAAMQKSYQGKAKDANNDPEKETVLRRPKKESDLKRIETIREKIEDTVPSGAVSVEEGQSKYTLTEQNGAIKKKIAQTSPKLPDHSTNNGKPKLNDTVQSSVQNGETKSTTKTEFSYANCFNHHAVRKEKENMNLNSSSYTTCSSLNTSIDTSIIDKVTGQVDEIILADEGYKKEMSKLDKERHLAKQKSAGSNITSTESNPPRSRQILRKVAASFSNTK